MIVLPKKAELAISTHTPRREVYHPPICTYVPKGNEGQRLQQQDDKKAILALCNRLAEVLCNAVIYAADVEEKIDFRANVKVLDDSYDECMDIVFQLKQVIEAFFEKHKTTIFVEFTQAYLIT